MTRSTSWWATIWQTALIALPLYVVIREGASALAALAVIAVTTFRPEDKMETAEQGLTPLGRASEQKAWRAGAENRISEIAVVREVRSPSAQAAVVRPRRQRDFRRARDEHGKRRTCSRVA